MLTSAVFDDSLSRQRSLRQSLMVMLFSKEPFAVAFGKKLPPHNRLQAILAAMDSPSSSESPCKGWAKVEARIVVALWKTPLYIRCECGRRVCNPKYSKNLMIDNYSVLDGSTPHKRSISFCKDGIRDWGLVQDSAGKTASSLGMKSHIHCLHGFCTQVCFCLL